MFTKLSFIHIKWETDCWSYFRSKYNKHFVFLEILGFFNGSDRSPQGPVPKTFSLSYLIPHPFSKLCFIISFVCYQSEHNRLLMMQEGSEESIPVCSCDFFLSAVTIREELM